ncbi:oligogalacturonate-specific porin KdgM family protein [Vibrio sp. AK197]
MMKYKNLALTISAALLATSVSAASLDFRQEYKHESESYSSRVKIGGAAGNHYFGVEAKQKGNPFDEGWESGDNEFDYGYKLKLDEHWLLQPGMPVTFGSDKVTFKPQLRVQYSFDSGLKAKLRYRHEIRKYTDDAGTDTEQKSKLTANLDYGFENLAVGLEANYEKSLDDVIFFDNKDSNWDVNMKISYKEADWAWKPYVEFGNVSVSSTSGDRQLRSRVGLTYSF